MFKNGHISPQMKSKSRVCCEGGGLEVSQSQYWPSKISPPLNFYPLVHLGHKMLWLAIRLFFNAYSMHAPNLEHNLPPSPCCTIPSFSISGHKSTSALYGTLQTRRLRTQALLLADICSPAEGYFACIGSSWEILCAGRLVRKPYCWPTFVHRQKVTSRASAPLGKIH